MNRTLRPWSRNEIDQVGLQPQVDESGGRTWVTCSGGRGVAARSYRSWGPAQGPPWLPLSWEGARGAVARFTRNGCTLRPLLRVAFSCSHREVAAERLHEGYLTAAPAVVQKRRLHVRVDNSSAWHRKALNNYTQPQICLGEVS